ncbi:hypothetical protein Fot_49823 [Forsythia ovata]|uniref:IBB domain-containing protein n=1 Tax=Forsythia ovata TaxID=205694 RepID=A0ABD1QCZ4_9LAMI
MSMNDVDRCEDALRKKELKNKRRRELYAKSQQEKNMHQPQSDCNSTLSIDENMMPQNRRRRDVSATTAKQLAQEIQGNNIQRRQRKSMRFVGVSNCLFLALQLNSFQVTSPASNGVILCIESEFHHLCFGMGKA